MTQPSKGAFFDKEKSTMVKVAFLHKASSLGIPRHESDALLEKLVNFVEENNTPGKPLDRESMKRFAILCLEETKKILPSKDYIEKHGELSSGSLGSLVESIERRVEEEEEEVEETGTGTDPVPHAHTCGCTVSAKIVFSPASNLDTVKSVPFQSRTPAFVPGATCPTPLCMVSSTKCAMRIADITLRGDTLDLSTRLHVNKCACVTDRWWTQECFAHELDTFAKQYYTEVCRDLERTAFMFLCGTCNLPHPATKKCGELSMNPSWTSSMIVSRLQKGRVFLVPNGFSHCSFEDLKANVVEMSTAKFVDVLFDTLGRVQAVFDRMMHMCGAVNSLGSNPAVASAVPTMNAIFRDDRYTAMVCNIFEAIVSWQLGLCVHAACDTPGYMDQDLCGNHWCMERATMHCDSCMKTAFCSQECAVLAAGLLPCLRRQEPEFTFNIAATLGISYCVVSPKFVTATLIGPLSTCTPWRLGCYFHCQCWRATPTWSLGNSN